MSLGKTQEIFSANVAQFIVWLNTNKYTVRIGECQRTAEQQALYVKNGSSKTLLSAHIDKRAIDLHIFLDNKWITEKDDLLHIGEYWESLNPKNRWGGNWASFVDTPHFEMLL